MSFKREIIYIKNFGWNVRLAAPQQDLQAGYGSPQVYSIFLDAFHYSQSFAWMPYTKCSSFLTEVQRSLVLFEIIGLITEALPGNFCWLNFNVTSFLTYERGKKGLIKKDENWQTLLLSDLLVCLYILTFFHRLFLEFFYLTLFEQGTKPDSSRFLQV